MIYYVAFYNPIQELGRRVANYAGEDKIDYICEKFECMDEPVTILSNTKSIKKKYLKRMVYIENKKKIVMFASFPKCNVVLHALDVLYGYIQLAIYLWIHVKKDDVVLVYHSLGYRNVIQKIRKIKKFRYILEVEELFQFVKSANSSFKLREKTVFAEPDSFLFSNSFLNEKINIKNKPFIIINGIYKNQNLNLSVQTRRKKRVVYAGTLDQQKGVDYVIRAAQFLNENYEMKVIGFGSQQDIERVRKLIEEINEHSKCDVFYDGVFKGQAYLDYLQGCDVGVCIQDPGDTFNLYEFPSKILSYMSNGLNVVTNRLEQIENSKIYPYLTIADGITPEEVSTAIIKACKKEKNAQEILKHLDQEFEVELKKMIKGEKQLC